VFHTFRDDARRRITVTVTQSVNLSDSVKFLQQLQREDTWTYSVLYDARGLPAVDVTSVDLQAVAAHVTSAAHDASPRGPVAVVTEDPGLLAASAQYANLVRGAGILVAAFPTIAAADEWLDRRTRQHS
jgi:hypothetical protein